MEELSLIAQGVALVASAWLAGTLVHSGHDDAKRSSHDEIEANLQLRIAAAKDGGGRAMLEDARARWRASRPPIEPRWWA